MIIKKINATRATAQVNKFKKYFNVLSYFSLAISILFILIVTMFVHNNPREFQTKYKKFDNRYGISNIKFLPEIIGYNFKNIFVKPERININIKHIDLQKIEYMRINALNGEKLFEYVPAKITHNSSIYPAKIRLKGDRKVHYDTLDNSSFRIKIKKNQTLFGMNVFSIQKPRVRNYLEEWVFLKMMEDEGLVSPRYQFINVSVNGKGHGLFVVEEHYSKYLIEKNKYKDGPIIRFDENSSHDFKLATIKPFESKKWEKLDNVPLAKKAVYLLDGFRKGHLSMDKVFNVTKLAKLFAIADLNSARHGVVTKSLRFYYNPITSRLEPIPFDGHKGTSVNSQMISAELGINELKNWTYKEYGNWFRFIFNNDQMYNKEFYSVYIKTLNRISQKKYLDDFFETHNDEIDIALKQIYSDYSLNDNIFSFGPFPYFFNKKSYYDNQKFIKNHLKEPLIESYVVSLNNNRVIIDIKNNNKALPVEIISIIYGNQVINYDGENNVILKYDEINSKNNYKRFVFHLNSDDKKIKNNTVSNINVNYKYPGLDDIYSIKSFPWSSDGLSQVKSDMLRMPFNAKLFPFIKIDNEKKILLIEEGKYEVANNMIIPPGYVFTIDAGVTLSLKKGVSIISHSALKWFGNIDRPIVINSSDVLEKGQGLFVINANSLSEMTYVNFKNLTSPRLNDWKLSGSISFYESDIAASNIQVENNDAEDGINIIRSNFIIKDSSFYNIKSDAIDVDFGEGSIENTTFNIIGNDAIDVSGTKLVLNNLKIIAVSDKAISAGEESSINGEDVIIRNSEICITSKDNSLVSLNRLSLFDSKLGFTAFQKKTEFGPGSINIHNYKYNNITLQHAIEKKSSLTLENVLLNGEINDVKKILYGNEYGKKSE